MRFDRHAALGEIEAYVRRRRSSPGHERKVRARAEEMARKIGDSFAGDLSRLGLSAMQHAYLLKDLIASLKEVHPDAEWVERCLAKISELRQVLPEAANLAKYPRRAALGLGSTRPSVGAADAMCSTD